MPESTDAFAAHPHLAATLGRGLQSRADRRSLFQRTAAAGLAFSTLGALGRGAMAATTQPAGTNMGTGEAAGPPRPFVLYDPVLRPVDPGPKTFAVTMQDATLQIAPNTAFAAWTFDGTIPGKPLRAVVGDKLTVSIHNQALDAHSLDLHAAQTPPNQNYHVVLPGQSFEWTFSPAYPGAFLYHCGTMPMLLHLASGLYGAIIVDPPGGWPAAQELVMVQSEFYIEKRADGVAQADVGRLTAIGFPDLMAFNGHATQYADHPIPVKVGQPIRIFVVNAGPNHWSSFHVVGAIFDRVYPNANPKNMLTGLQSISIGPGDGAAVEFTLKEPGRYTAVNHSFGLATQGALAYLQAA